MITTTRPVPNSTAVTLKVLRLRTPVGRIAVILTPENDVVQAAGFCTPDVLLARLPPGLSTRGAVAAPARGPVADAVAAYSDGDLNALGAVPVDQPGGPFLQRAWQALRTVPAGTTISYTGLATAAGRPAAVRRGVGVRAEPHRLLRALPPGPAQRRLARRLPVRTGRQRAAAAPRGPLTRCLGHRLVR